MKKFVAGALLLLFVISAQAQWYQKYGANSINDLSKEQLEFSLQKAESNVKTGKILTFSGLGAGAIGIVLGIHGLTSTIIHLENNVTELVAGELLLIGGIGSMVVGIPIWIVGANRRNKIEIALINLNSSSYSGNNQRAYFGYKQSSAPGLSLKINF